MCVLVIVNSIYWWVYGWDWALVGRIIIEDKGCSWWDLGLVFIWDFYIFPFYRIAMFLGMV